MAYLRLVRRLRTSPVKQTITALILMAILAACTRRTPPMTEHLNAAILVAEQFGQAIVRGDFEAAHALLADETQRTYSPAALKTAVTDMIAYAEAPLQHATVMREVVMEDWPDKQPGDLAWVYVSLQGESFSEAVTVVLADTKRGARIRELEWGRP